MDFYYERYTYYNNSLQDIFISVIGFVTILEVAK